MINKRKSKAIVLHNGGLDSTVCILQALEQNKEVLSLGIDYNQKHRIENQYASTAPCDLILNHTYIV